MDKTAEVKEMSLRKVQDIEVEGGSPIFATQLRDLLLRYADMFRLEIGRDPPVDMPPLRVKLRNDTQIDCFQTCKHMICSAGLLAYPDPSTRVCVFTDASDLHWGRLSHRCPWRAWTNL